MDTGFDLLEQRVRKAADLVKSLRRHNQSLEEDLKKAKNLLRDAERRLDSLEKSKTPSESSTREASLQEEISFLRKEREEVRGRIGKLVEVLDALE